jgi:organic radical activating enzyme
MEVSMLYRIESGKIRTASVEFAAADHCNLRCAGCSHMSPFLRPRLHNEDELARDMGRLATAMRADHIRILGGEPLLNPRIVAILKAARASGIADRVSLTTNGLLLHAMSEEFWANVDEVHVSLYIRARTGELLIDQVRKRADESGTQLFISEYSSFRVTMVTEPHSLDLITTMIYRTCKNAHLYRAHLVHGGWLYKCSCPAYLGEFLGSMGKSGYRAEDDGFDIHGATNLRQQLWEYLTNKRPLDACRHCLGYVGKIQDHRQLVAIETRDPRSRPVTRKTHLDLRILVTESLRYFRRRAKETLTGKARW